MEENESNIFKSVKTQKNKGSFSKSVVLPFVSGILGASLVIGVCFGVPEVKERIVEKEAKAETSYDTVQASATQVNNTGISLKEYSETAVAVAEKVQPSICRNRNRI